jgi:hypothetical protein
MIVKAKGRSALILTAGLLLCCAGTSPAKAAPDDSSAVTTSSPDATASKPVRPTKPRAHHQSNKTSSKDGENKKTGDGAVADAATPSSIPASVGNSRGQFVPNPLSENAGAMSARANTLLSGADKPADAGVATETDVVAADQLNDVDRALQDSQSPPAAENQTVAMAPIKAGAATAALIGSESSTWDKTSLIGKIFIAAGALLTMASAARMFLA